MHKKRSGNITHSLYVAEIRSKNGKGRKDILEGLIELASFLEVAKVVEGSVEVFFNDFNVLFECLIVLDVVFSQAYSHQQCLVQLHVNS